MQDKALSELELHTKRREIERLERQQEKLFPEIKEAQAERERENKRVATGRKRAQRLLALGEQAGLKWMPAKSTAHRKALTNLLALALRPQEDESVWERVGHADNDFPAIAVMA